MLGRVRERFRDDVIRRDLDRLRQAVVDDVAELDRNRRTAGERPQGRGETSLGEDGRMDSA